MAIVFDKDKINTFQGFTPVEKTTIKFKDAQPKQEDVSLFDRTVQPTIDAVVEGVSTVADVTLDFGINTLGAAAGALGGGAAAAIETQRQELSAFQAENEIKNLISGTSGLPEQPGEAYMNVFQTVTEAIHYTPTTPGGMKVREGFEYIFGAFEEWGGDGGDIINGEGLGNLIEPGNEELATAVHTVIAGIPYVAGFMLGAIRPKKGFNFIKGKRAEKAQGRTEAIKEQLDVPVEQRLPEAFPQPRVSEKNTVNKVMEDVGIDPTTTPPVRGVQELLTLSEVIDTSLVKKTIRIKKDADGKKTLLDPRDADVLILQSNIKDATVKTTIIEDTPAVKRSPSMQRIVDKDATSIQKNFEKQREDNLIRNKVSIAATTRFLKRGIFDPSTTFVDAARKHSEEALAQARINIGSAKPKALFEMQKIRDNFTKDLNKKEFELTEEVMQSIVNSQIDKNMGAGKVKHPGGNTGAQFNNYLVKLSETLDKKTYDKVVGKAEKVFLEFNKELDTLLIEGIVSPKKHKQLKKVLYIPRQFIEAVDPLMNSKGLSLTNRTHESGLPELTSGNTRSLRLDPIAMLTEYKVRNANTIAWNKAKTSLNEFAENNDVGWVRPVKSGKSNIPDGFIKVGFKVKGDDKFFVIEKEIGESFLQTGNQLSPLAANVMKVASLNFAIKPLAVGYNPLVALGLFPLDLGHAILSSTHFSGNIPKAGVQMLTALKDTRKDAFGMKGRLDDFINEGGGLNMLVDQGHSMFERTQVATKTKNAKLHKFGEALSRTGKVLETWVRLADREQGIKNGLSPEQASFNAKTRLDYNQVGSIGQVAETVIPFINAATQALRGTLRRLKTSKPEDRIPGTNLSKQFASKIAWIQGLTAIGYLSNYYTNKQGWGDTTDDQRRRYHTFMTPLRFIDNNNMTRNVGFRMRKDNAVSMFGTPVDMLMEGYYEGRTPEDYIFETLKRGSPLIPSDAIPPSIKVIDAFVNNKGRFGELWRSQELPAGLAPEAETDENVSPWIREMSQLMGLSPKATEASIDAVFPSNPVTSGVGMGLNALIQGMTPQERSQTTLELLATNPFLKKFVFLTSPLDREFEKLDDAISIGGPEKLKLSQELESLMIQKKNGEIKFDVNDMQAWARTKTDVDQLWLQRRYQTAIVLDQVFDRDLDTIGDGVPHKPVWMKASRRDSVERADWYYWAWRGADVKGRRSMEKILGGLTSVGVRFADNIFLVKMRQLKKEWGTDFYDLGDDRINQVTPRDSRGR